MNKQLLCITLLCLTVFGGRHALAAPKDLDVRYTVHNFSYNEDFISAARGERQYRAQSLNATTTQVCIFCHTPHNAAPSVPLWNKGFGAPGLESTYRLYTSSSTLSNTVKHNSVITATSPSLLCLSCHDGKTAINVLHNASVRSGTDSTGDAIIDVGFGAAGIYADGTSFANIWQTTAGPYPSNLGAIRDADGGISSFQNAQGGDGLNSSNLTDDHPIGFSYDDVLAEAGKLNDLHTVDEAKLATDSDGMKVRFFGPKNNVECSSCHNPHVYYGYGRAGTTRKLMATSSTDSQKDRTPFLVRGNTGSALCLACHKK